LAVYPSRGRENSCVERERIESEKKGKVRKGRGREAEEEEEGGGGGGGRRRRASKHSEG